MIRHQDVNLDTILIRYFENIAILIWIFLNEKYVNLIQAQEQNVSVQQGSLIYVDTKINLKMNCRLS